MQPTPGWTDSLAAAGGLMLLGSIGVLKNLNSNGNTHFDVVPVDIVTNGIIISTAYGALQTT